MYMMTSLVALPGARYRSNEALLTTVGQIETRFSAIPGVRAVGATSLLPLITQGHYLAAATLYVFGAIGFSGNTMFTDALLTDVAEPKNYDRVSAFGYGLGYLGGGGMFAFCTWVLASPETFGLADKVAAAKFCFVLTAGWWLVFTIPCLLWIHETPGTPNAGEGSGD